MFKVATNCIFALLLTGALLRLNVHPRLRCGYAER